MSQTIRIAVPTSAEGGIDAPRSAHFGHAESFTIVDVAEGRIAGSTVVTNPPHSHGGCGQTVRLLADNDDASCRHRRAVRRHVPHPARRS